MMERRLKYAGGFWYASLALYGPKSYLILIKYSLAIPCQGSFPGTAMSAAGSSRSLFMRGKRRRHSVSRDPDSNTVSTRKEFTFHKNH